MPSRPTSSAILPRVSFNLVLLLSSQRSPSCSFPLSIRTRRPPRSLAPALSVIVRFKATGNAPIMKQNFYKITASNKFQAVIAFLRKELGWKASDGLVSILLGGRG